MLISCHTLSHLITPCHPHEDQAPPLAMWSLSLLSGGAAAACCCHCCLRPASLGPLQASWLWLAVVACDTSARCSVALPALRTGSPAPYTAHFPPAAARGPMAFGLRLVRHFFLSFFLRGTQCSRCQCLSSARACGIHQYDVKVRVEHLLGGTIRTRDMKGSNAACTADSSVLHEQRQCTPEREWTQAHLTSPEPLSNVVGR